MAKWIFRKDDDCHWYMIPAEKSKVFSSLIRECDNEGDFENFWGEFDQYRIDSPLHYTFENPEEI